MRAQTLQHIGLACPYWLALLPAKPNRVQNKERETKRGVEGERGSHNVPQYIAALQIREGVAYQSIKSRSRGLTSLLLWHNLEQASA